MAFNDFDVDDDDDDIIEQAAEDAAHSQMKEKPADIAVVKKLGIINIERGDMIYRYCKSTKVDVMGEIVGEGKYKICSTIFDGFENHTTLVYEDESLVEEYEPKENSFFVKEKLGLNSYGHAYYCNSSPLLNRLGQRIKPLNSTREEIAKKFLNLILKEEQRSVNLFVLCFENLDNENPPTGIPYYKFLGSYHIDQVESLANGAITWKRINDNLTK